MSEPTDERHAARDVQPRAEPESARGQIPLTPRHLEILALVATGKTNRQVGEELGISERTVRNHLREVQHRLATSDRTHAVVVAIGRGWITIPIEPETTGAPVPHTAAGSA